ncbi:MAG: hypothetical protein ACKOTH_02765, partial [Solirubrobacterales bacterium]
VERLRSTPAQEHDVPLVLAATDPAQPWGGVLKWPQREGQAGAGPRRVAGAYVVLCGADPVLYAERGGRGLLVLVDDADPRVTPALGALAEWVTGGAGRVKLALERVNGEPVVGSPWEPMLVEAGFRQGPKKLTLSA